MKDRMCNMKCFAEYNYSSDPSVIYCPRMSFHCFPLFHLSQKVLMPVSKPMPNANAPAKMEVT